MRKSALAALLALSLSVAALSGCAVVQAPLSGVLVTNVKGPVAATEQPTSSKVGKASAISVLGLVAAGDASIDKAAKDTGITKIHHVDYKSFSVLGIFARYTVFVYGD